MVRPFFTILTTLSLLLWLAVSALWIRSHYCWDALVCGADSHRSVALRSAAGQMEFRLRIGGKPDSPFHRFGWFGYKPEPPLDYSKPPYSELMGILTDDMFFRDDLNYYRQVIFDRWGLAIHHAIPIIQALRQRGIPIDDDGATGQFWAVQIADGWLLLATGIPPAAAITTAARRFRRTSRGLCPTCAYDLRASKDRCPECGTPHPKPAPRRHRIA